ncbi:MAG: HlyD family type I secretion periplasmic adaptor subunit [Hyphomicrobium sp.]|jgi:HlyD family secretion protein|nr:HlyD family type I secretion periplasmic adaptor subunit [Hyphomicrobium sp.]
MSTEPAKIPSTTTENVKLDGNLISVKRYVVFGFATLFVLVGGLGGWAATTDLSGAVIAPGTVVVASSVKKIQHPSGGIIGKIFVKNGDHVKAGEVLVRLDETVTRAQLQVITKQMDELRGRQARLRAERDGAATVAFPDDLLARAAESDVGHILSGERTLFESRLRSREAQKAQLSERIAGLQEEVAGLTSQADAKSRELNLIGKELAGLETLETQRLVPTSKMMSIRREGARLEGEKAQLQAAAGSSRGRIAEIELQKLGIDIEARSDIIKDLRETEGRLVELSERRTAAEDQLRRIELTSPVDGVVHQLTVHTVGGVINPAEQLMLVVPADDRLVVEAKIAPHDIDQARMHEDATIRFPAFNQRTTPTLSGRVRDISADLTRDQQTGMSYFTANVEIPESEMPKLNGHKLMPGMPAEVQIATISRSALSYLVKPLEDAFAKAFRER